MVIRLTGIEKSFSSGFLMRRRPVLRGFDLSIGSGEAYALLGANGAGKSTALRILLGLSRPDCGHGIVLGEPLGCRAVQARIGYLPENPSFHDQLSAQEFLTYCGQLLNLRGMLLRQRIDALLERVGLEAARQQKLRKLSKGMLQRLGIAQALLGDPELLILDEPMSGLDPPGRKFMRDLIVEERQRGATVLFSTHILSDAEAVCTRAGILQSGQLAAELVLDDLQRQSAVALEVTLRNLSDAAIERLQVLSRRTVRSGVCVTFDVEPGQYAHELIQNGIAAGGQLEAVVPRRAALEDLFLRVTSVPIAATAAPVVPHPLAAPAHSRSGARR